MPPADVELGELGVIDRHGQAVAVFGVLSVAVVRRQGGQCRPFGFVRPPAGAEAVSQEPRDALRARGLGPDAGEGEADQGRRLDGAADRLRWPEFPSRCAQGARARSSRVLARWPRMLDQLVAPATRDPGWRT